MGARASVRFSPCSRMAKTKQTWIALAPPPQPGNLPRQGESDGHPIIGHYVIGRHACHQRTMSCAPAAVGLFPSYVMAIIRRPRLQILPLALRFARPLAQLAGLTSLTPPLGTSALFRNAVKVRIRHFCGDGKEISPSRKQPTRRASPLDATLQVAFAAEAIKALRQALINSAKKSHGA
jgi:hypothetical protein